MPSDEYASAAGGALRLKGAKVDKHKKKHKHGKHKHRRTEDQLAKALDDKAKDGKDSKDGKDGRDGPDDRAGEAAAAAPDGSSSASHDPYAHMTDAERHFAEAQERKIRNLMMADPEEARAAHPELFKTHKERLADLNAYLSRMSEHHDMPKIGPG